MPVHCIVTPALNTLVAIYTTGRGAALLFSIFFVNNTILTVKLQLHGGCKFVKLSTNQKKYKQLRLAINYVVA